MFGMGKIKQYAAREDMSEVESWLVGQSLRFAAELVETHKEVPQIFAATEGLAMMLHSLRRETYRAAEFKVWDTIFEPSIKQMYQLFAMTLAAWMGVELDRATMARDAETVVSSRNLEYQTLPFLYSPVEDRQTVVWAGSNRLAELIDPARREDIMATVQKLYARFVEFALPDQVSNLSMVLYGGRRGTAAA